MDPKSLECPSCGRADRVQKASAVVRAGQSTGSSEGGGYVYTVNSPLAYQLRRPSKDDAPGIGCSVPVLLIGGAFAVIIGLSYLFLFVFIIVSGFNQRIAMTPENIPSAAFYLVLIGLPGALGILAIRTARRKMAFAKNEVPGAQAAWDNLYFCSRCDGGFVPAKAEFVPIAKLREYLYRK